MKFILETITRTADAAAQRIAALNHEAGDDAVKDRAIVERLLHFLAGLRVAPFFGSAR